MSHASAARRTFLIGLLGLAAPACAQPDTRLRVFAAASLTDALQEAGDAYAALGHARPLFNFAASSTLARQIEQGARADLFFSADEDWMEYLAAHALIAPETRVSLLSNRLVLIAPADRVFALRLARGADLAAALRGGRLAIADPSSVPAGRYGQAALTHLSMWDSVASSVVRAENVRSALRFVELGEAAAGVVYATDARAAGDRVAVVDTFPADSHPPISYPMAVVAGRANAPARDFARFLQSDAADAIFERHGFSVR